MKIFDSLLKIEHNRVTKYNRVSFCLPKYLDILFEHVQRKALLTVALKSLSSVF